MKRAGFSRQTAAALVLAAIVTVLGLPRGHDTTCLRRGMRGLFGLDNCCANTAPAEKRNGFVCKAASSSSALLPLTIARTQELKRLESDNTVALPYFAWELPAAELKRINRFVIYRETGIELPVGSAERRTSVVAIISFQKTRKLPSNPSGVRALIHDADGARELALVSSFSGILSFNFTDNELVRHGFELSRNAARYSIVAFDKRSKKFADSGSFDIGATSVGNTTSDGASGLSAIPEPLAPIFNPAKQTANNVYSSSVDEPAPKVCCLCRYDQYDPPYDGEYVTEFRERCEEWIQSHPECTYTQIFALENPDDTVALCNYAPPEQCQGAELRYQYNGHSSEPESKLHIDQLANLAICLECPNVEGVIAGCSTFERPEDALSYLNSQPLPENIKFRMWGAQCPLLASTPEQQQAGTCASTLGCKLTFGCEEIEYDNCPTGTCQPKTAFMRDCVRCMEDGVLKKARCFPTGPDPLEDGEWRTVEQDDPCQSYNLCGSMHTCYPIPGTGRSECDVVEPNPCYPECPSGPCTESWETFCKAPDGTLVNGVSCCGMEGAKGRFYAEPGKACPRTHTKCNASKECEVVVGRGTSECVTNISCARSSSSSSSTTSSSGSSTTSSSGSSSTTSSSSSSSSSSSGSTTTTTITTTTTATTTLPSSTTITTTSTTTSSSTTAPSSSTTTTRTSTTAQTTSTTVTTSTVKPPISTSTTTTFVPTSTTTTTTNTTQSTTSTSTTSTTAPTVTTVTTSTLAPTSSTTTVSRTTVTTAPTSTTTTSTQPTLTTTTTTVTSTTTGVTQPTATTTSTTTTSSATTTSTTVSTTIAPTTTTAPTTTVPTTTTLSTTTTTHPTTTTVTTTSTVTSTTRPGSGTSSSTSGDEWAMRCENYSCHMTNDPTLPACIEDSDCWGGPDSNYSSSSTAESSSSSDFSTSSSEY